MRRSRRKRERDGLSAARAYGNCLRAMKGLYHIRAHRPNAEGPAWRVDVAGLEIEFGRHSPQDRARALADGADGQPTTMVGMTPQIARFVVHPKQTNIC